MKSAVIVSDARGQKRTRILAEVVPDRKCPECRGGPLVQGRQWVLLHSPEKNLDIAICRSCFQINWERDSQSGLYRKKSKKRKKFAPWFAKITTFVVDPSALVLAREARGISQAKLADILGWSRTRLRRLETTTAEISQVDVDAIKEVLDR